MVVAANAAVAGLFWASPYPSAAVVVAAVSVGAEEEIAGALAADAPAHASDSAVVVPGRVFARVAAGLAGASDQAADAAGRHFSALVAAVADVADRHFFALVVAVAGVVGLQRSVIAPFDPVAAADRRFFALVAAVAGVVAPQPSVPAPCGLAAADRRFFAPAVVVAGVVAP